MRKLRAVIFDWAGTMIDFGSLAPVEAMKRAFTGEGIEIADADIRADMGLAKLDHVRALLARPRVAEAFFGRFRRAATETDALRIYAALEPLMLCAGAERAQLIPGAREAFHALKLGGIAIGSTTGYTRAMMAPIARAAADAGYAPEVIICAGETKTGRPSPLMCWKAMVELGVFPAAAVVKVDDAPVGIEEGKAAGCFTIGVAASGNGMGLDLPEYLALDAEERERRLAAAATPLHTSGADLVIPSVADLLPALRERFDWP